MKPERTRLSSSFPVETYPRSQPLQPLVLLAAPNGEADSVETFTGLETLETIPNAALAANRVKMSYWMTTISFCLSLDASNSVTNRG